MEEETEKISSKEGGCPESSKVERRSVSNCRRNGVNPAISAKETIPNKIQPTTVEFAYSDFGYSDILLIVTPVAKSRF